MTTVERIRQLCKDKGISIARLEKDLDFGNGYLNPKKIRTIKTDRLMMIAKYLDSPLSDILGEEDYAEMFAKKEKPTPRKEDGLTDDQKEIIALIHQMTPQEIDVLLATAKALLQSPGNL